MAKPETGASARRVRYAALSGVILALGLTTAARAADDEASQPPVPADPHDISGLWYSAGFYDPANRTVKPMEGGDPPFTPAGQALFKKRRDADKAGAPYWPIAEGCATSSFLGFRPGAPDQIIQVPGQISFIQETYHDFNVIHMDKSQPKNPTPTFQGHSVGHWEGDTLVVDTIAYRDGIWLDYTGTPAGPQLHIVQRIKKVNFGKTVLEDIMTITDPEYYTKPWNVRRVFMWRPNERITEEVCEDSLGEVNPEKVEARSNTFTNK
jgi:hypothetical protein